MIRMLQEKLSGALQDVFVELVFHLPIEITAHIRKFVVEELDHVEMVKDNRCLGKMRKRNLSMKMRHLRRQFSVASDHLDPMLVY